MITTPEPGRQSSCLVVNVKPIRLKENRAQMPQDLWTNHLIAVNNLPIAQTLDN